MIVKLLQCVGQQEYLLAFLWALKVVLAVSLIKPATGFISPAVGCQHCLDKLLILPREKLLAMLKQEAREERTLMLPAYHRPSGGLCPVWTNASFQDRIQIKSKRLLAALSVGLLPPPCCWNSGVRAKGCSPSSGEGSRVR